MAYFWVQLLAVVSYLALSVLYMWAISGTSGSSGFGSVKREQIERSTWKWEQPFPPNLKNSNDERVKKGEKHPCSSQKKRLPTLKSNFHQTLASWSYEDILLHGNSNYG